MAMYLLHSCNIECEAAKVRSFDVDMLKEGELSSPSPRFVGVKPRFPIVHVVHVRVTAAVCSLGFLSKIHLACRGERACQPGYLFRDDMQSRDCTEV